MVRHTSKILQHMLQCKVFEMCLTILGRYALPVNLWFSAAFLINFNSCEIVWEALSCNFRLISASLVDVIQLWYYQILFIPDFHIHVRKSEWFVNQFKWSCFSKNPVIWLAESIWVITWEKKTKQWCCSEKRYDIRVMQKLRIQLVKKHKNIILEAILSIFYPKFGKLVLRIHGQVSIQALSTAACHHENVLLKLRR